MLGQNDDVLNFGYDVHIDAAILIFSGRCQALSVFNGGQDDSVRGYGAFYAIHTKRQAEAGREFVNQRAFRSVLQ
ncbi:hypothetical protein D3C73_1530650 [compost metagenome]